MIYAHASDAAAAKAALAAEISGKDRNFTSRAWEKGALQLAKYFF
jgi:hypothetical protein